MNKNTYYLTLFLLFFIHNSFGQLSNFTLTVTPTNETCTGNGALAFSTSGTTTGSIITYSIYLSPNTVTPLAVTNNTIFTGLNSGVYTVVATQVLGSLSNTQQQNAVIQNLVIPIVYQISGQSETCNDGTISVNVTQGNPTSYQIISGPVIVAPQSSNVFTGLQSGVYNVRVNDACGDGVVQTYTVQQIQYLTVGVFNKSCLLVNCTTSSGTFTVEANPGYSINYPLNVIFTVTPPGGGTPVQITQTVTSGNNLSQQITMNFPYYQGQVAYSIAVTDACSNTFSNTGNSMNVQLTLSLSPNPSSSCVKSIQLSLCDYLPPFTVTFLNSPAGFNPAVFNSTHPGPFSADFITYTSTQTNQIPNGNYTVSVTDACGRTAQNNVVIEDFQHEIIFTQTQPPCSPLTNVMDNIGGPDIASVLIIAAPSTYGFPLPHNVSSNINDGNFLMGLMPGTYTFLITDICGFSIQSTLTIPPRTFTPSALGGNTPGCSPTTGFINVSVTGGVLVAISIISAPSTFTQTLPLNVSSAIVSPGNTSATILSLPSGTYVLSVTDTCGLTQQVTAVVPLIISQVLPIVDYRRGCTIDSSSLSFYSPNGALQSVIITAAPTSFGQNLPYDVTFNVAPNGRFYMNSLPEGLYTFVTIDACGVTKTNTLSILGFKVNSNSAIVQGNCGSFNLNLQYVSNFTVSMEFWLQKLDPLTGQWGHPFTGVAFVNGSAPNGLNSFQLTNMTNQLNIVSLGTFRILKSYFQYSNGTTALSNCTSTIQNFVFTGNLSIQSVFAIPCSNNGTEVFINAAGVAPLNYTITTKDNLPFPVNNGTNNVFSGLQPGIYNFQVTDLCGNIVNSLLDITSLPEPAITANNLCNGSTGDLSVEYFPLFNYEWWKGTATTTILSTTNVLTFNPFSNLTTPGTYYVRIYAPNSISCADKIISFVVPPSVVPNAGQDGSVVLCGNPNSPIDLSNVLQGNHDNNGTWQEITNSGSIVTGNNWNPTGVAFGTYEFKYSVAGSCNSLDEATVLVTINEIPTITSIDAGSGLCTGTNIQLSVTSISGVTYEWTGPNNFQSTDQNPIITNATSINNGIYNLKTTLNGCEDTDSIQVTINEEPDFSIVSGCDSNVFTVQIIPNQQSFNVSDVSYSWSGPNGFTSSANPLILTGQPKGTYTVNVTNSGGCSTEQFLVVENTLCSIPQGVSPNGDGANDSWDLSGFDIDNIKIFNRYGMVVYRKDSYEDEWYGQDYNGHLLPSATYYYQVVLTNGKIETGWVYLQRS